MVIKCNEPKETRIRAEKEILRRALINQPDKKYLAVKWQKTNTTRIGRNLGPCQTSTISDLMGTKQILDSIDDPQYQADEIWERYDELDFLGLDEKYVLVNDWGYVRRREIWEVLDRTRLSINQAAKILGRGESFRRWARRSSPPNEITRVSEDELRRLYNFCNSR